MGVVSFFLAFSMGSSTTAEEPVQSGGRAVPGRDGWPGTQGSGVTCSDRDVAGISSSKGGKGRPAAGHSFPCKSPARAGSVRAAPRLDGGEPEARGEGTDKKIAANPRRLPRSCRAGDTAGPSSPHCHNNVMRPMLEPGPPHLPRRRGRPCRGGPARRRPAAGRCRRRPGRGAPRRWSSSTGGRSYRSRWWRRRRRSARGTGSRPASRPARPASRGSTRRWPRPPPAAASPAPPAAASPAWRRRGGGRSVRAPPRRGSAARPPGAGSRRAAGTLAAGPAAAACPGPARGVRSRRPGRTGGAGGAATPLSLPAASPRPPDPRPWARDGGNPRSSHGQNRTGAPRPRRAAPGTPRPAPRPLGAGGAAPALIGGGGGAARMRPPRPARRGGTSARAAAAAAGARGAAAAVPPGTGTRNSAAACTCLATCSKSVAAGGRAQGCTFSC